MGRDHRKLRVFHDAHALAIEIYRHTRVFPREDEFGLRSQMRRAAVSVATNIVEGRARGSARDYLRFLHVAFGSACELQYLILLVGELELLQEADRTTLTTACDRVVKQLNRLVEGVAGYSSAGP
jgi:four helix bundle protein